MAQGQQQQAGENGRELSGSGSPNEERCGRGCRSMGRKFHREPATYESTKHLRPTRRARIVNTAAATESGSPSSPMTRRRRRRPDYRCLTG